MRLRHLVVAFAAVVVTSRASAVSHKFRQIGHACITQSVLCGQHVTGELSPGDCTLSDGSRYDAWNFPGRAGDLVTVIVRSASGSLSRPAVFLDPPPGDASDTPLVAAGATQTVKYHLASTGTWRIIVGTLDVLGAGAYEIDLACGTANPSLPQNCVTQRLVCGNLANWTVNATSCRFQGGHPYAYFDVAAKGTDVLRPSVITYDFDPALSIYRGGGDALQSVFGRAFQELSTILRVPAADTYQIAIYSQELELGEFNLRLECSSNCTRPFITQQPAGARVAYLGRVELTVAVSGSPPFLYQWFDGAPPNERPLGAAGSDPRLLLTQLESDRVLWVRVTNDCGTVDSAAAFIDVGGAPRRRSVRR
jgi:hypothetical protein